LLEEKLVTRQEDDDHSGLVSLLAGIGVGVLVGGAVALLLAPQSGQQTRAQIRESADDALHKLRDSMDDLRTKVEDLASHARESVASRRGVATSALGGDVAGATDDHSTPVG
jgi:gas vesicle protein